MRVVAAAVAAICAISVPDLGAQGTLLGLLEIYRQGRHDEAIAKAAALPDLGPLRLQFVQQTPSWIAADPADAERRRAVVAGFLVEVAAARLESDWGRLSDLIEWTCAQVLRLGGPPTAFERHNGYRRAPMHPDTRARLVEHFTEPNRRLVEMLGPEFTWPT